MQRTSIQPGGGESVSLKRVNRALRCLRDWTSSIIRFVTLHGLWLTLRALCGCCPASRLPYAVTLSRCACTVVIWQARPASQLPPLVRAHTSTDSLSTSLSVLWKLSRMLATPGKLGEVDGTQDRKSTRLNSSHRTISYAVFC